jgi:hypothetical protein
LDDLGCWVGFRIGVVEGFEDDHGGASGDGPQPEGCGVFEMSPALVVVDVAAVGDRVAATVGKLFSDWLGPRAGLV